jgi:mycothiol synthase
MNMRAATPDDFERALELLRLDEENLTGRPSRIGPSDLRQWLGDATLGEDTWLHEEDGELVAFGWAGGFGLLGWAVGSVHPRAKGSGLGTQLVDRSEARLSERGVARAHQLTLSADTAAAALFEARGYREVRRFHEMAIELMEPPAAPVLPAGLALEIFHETYAHAFHAALEESFRDHWEHHARPFEEWWERRRSDPDFDASLWFLVRDGAEIAAVVRNDPNRNGGGMVSAIGVRRPWRGRGLGRALLLHTFGEFYRRGVTRVSLGVDSESPTGATKLYESVGMEVELEQTFFERALA